jgi:hypothetical protein
MRALISLGRKPAAMRIAAFMVALGAVSCVNLQNANRFTINGRNIELTDGLLLEFRKSWAPGTSIVTVLPKKDAQWTMDFIAITEGAARKPSCKSLSFEGKVTLEDKVDSFDGRALRTGRFDELWRISACGQFKRYRVVNPQGTSELVVYEPQNPNF